MKSQTERFVYLLRAGDSHYKVGIAHDVLARIKGVQNGNPMTLKIVATVFSEEAPAVELGLHKWLAQHKADGGREWFELTTEQALELVTRMTELTMKADISKYLTTRNLISRQTALEKKFDDLLNMDVIAKALEKHRAELEEAARAEQGLPESPKDTKDDLLDEAINVVQEAGKASASMLQRRMRVGYARAARLLDELEEAQIIGPADGARAREVLYLPHSPQKPRAAV